MWNPCGKVRESHEKKTNKPQWRALTRPQGYHVGPKLGQISPKWDKSGIFFRKISVKFWKVPDYLSYLVQIWPNWKPNRHPWLRQPRGIPATRHKKVSWLIRTPGDETMVKWGHGVRGWGNTQHHQSPGKKGGAGWGDAALLAYMSMSSSINWQSYLRYLLFITFSPIIQLRAP